MSRRQKLSSQRVVASHDVGTGTGAASSATTRGQCKPSKSRTSVTQASTASSRAKEKLQTSRINNTHGSKTSSMIQTSTHRSKTESKPKRKVPTESEAFYANLLLLGFDPDEISAKHRGSSIPFDKDMFQVPNMLAFQVVMHFLLNKLDTVRFHEEFRDCWPICDRKQEQAFRRACLSWLTDLDNDPDAHLPRLVPSLFLSPGGARFYQLMLCLSTYILIKLIRRDGHRSKMAMKIQHPVLTQKNNHLNDLLARTMKELISRRRMNFFSSIQQSIIVHKECEQFANELVKQYRRLNDDIKEKEKVLEKLRSESEVVLSPRGLDSVSDNRRQRIGSVRDQWSEISRYYQNSRKERDIVSSIIRGTIDKHRVHASDYSVHVPDLLIRNCHEDMQRRKIGNTYESGKMDLINVLKLWILSIEVLVKRAEEGSSLKLQNFAPNLLKHVHDAASYLANVRSLKNRVNEVDLPELRRSIAELKSAINDDDEVKTPGKFWQNTSNVLGFIPPTPPVNFDPAGGDDCILPRITGQTPPDVGRTPEAAERIVNDVRQRAQRKPPPANDTASKLPKRLVIDSSDGGDETLAPEPVLWRVRQHSAPGATSTGRISTPTRPRQAGHFTGKKIQQDPIPYDRKQMPLLKQPLVVRNVTKKMELETNNPTKPIIKGKKDSTRESHHADVQLHVKKRIVSKELVYDTPKSSKERAEEKLIDQIVDAVTGETPYKQSMSAESTPGYDTSDVNLQDPLLGLDQAPFRTRDKLAHSPVTSIDHSTAPETRRCHVQFSPNARVELEPSSFTKEQRNGDDKDHCSDVQRTPRSSSSPSQKVYISPLPEFDSPIDISRDANVNTNIPDIEVHEPSPARLKALSDEMKASIKKSPMISSVPVLDLEMMSPFDDVMNASVELVDLSSEDSDETENSTETVPTGNLIGFVPREPTPSCITPYKSQNESSLVIGQLSPGESPQRPLAEDDLNVLNSDERIEMVHKAERSFDEKMLDISLKVTGTPQYANKIRSRVGNNEESFGRNSLLELNDEDDIVGLPRTPMGVKVEQSPDSSPFLEKPTRITLDIGCDDESRPRRSTPSPDLTISNDFHNGMNGDLIESIGNSPRISNFASPKNGPVVKTNNTDIISRFRSLKLRAETQTGNSPSRSVLTPDEDKILDEIYLQQSPRQEPEIETTSVAGKFSLDIHFDELVDDSDTDVGVGGEDSNNNNNNSSYNKNGGNTDDESERMHDIETNNSRYSATNDNSMMVTKETASFNNLSVNLSGLLDLDADDILVPNSPTG